MIILDMSPVQRKNRMSRFLIWVRPSIDDVLQNLRRIHGPPTENKVFFSKFPDLGIGDVNGKLVFNWASNRRNEDDLWEL